MPLSSVRKKAGILTTTTASSNISRPSLIDTMLLTSTPLRRSPGIQTTGTSTRSATNLALQQIFKEKNQTYEDMHLLSLTKSMSRKEKRKEKKPSAAMNKSLKKRSKTRKTVPAEDEDEDEETENEPEMPVRRKPTPKKRKTTLSKQSQVEEPSSKKLRQITIANKKRATKIPTAKTSAGSSDACTTVDEENEETRLIEQAKLYIEGPGLRSNYNKIIEHNNRIGERIQSLRSHQQMPASLPSPILSRSTNARQDVIVAPAQTTSPVKIKTASRITFALPPQSVSPAASNVFDSIHPPSPQMPPTTTATSIDTQTDLFLSPLSEDKGCQTGPREIANQAIQTEEKQTPCVSVGIQYQAEQSDEEQHLLCRDLTTCTCVEQLVKTRQFLVETSNQLQSSTTSRTVKFSKQTMTVEETSPSNMVLAKSSLKAEQQIIFEQFLSQFHIRYSNTVDDTTTHLITDSLDENTPLVCPLTLKVIQATARHLPIISIQWLVACLTHQTIVPSQIYEIFLGDPTYGYHGGFLRSRIPRSQGLFQGIAFRFDCPEQDGCPAILADHRALRELIHLCDGTIVDEAHPAPSSTIIVLCNQLKRREQPCTAYVKPEWLLASIAQYNLQPFQQFAVQLCS